LPKVPKAKGVSYMQPPKKGESPLFGPTSNQIEIIRQVFDFEWKQPMGNNSQPKYDQIFYNSVKEVLISCKSEAKIQI
jgi:hypothetical protein